MRGRYGRSDSRLVAINWGGKASSFARRRNALANHRHSHSQSVSDLARAVAITTTLQFVTEDDVEQRTKLNLLLVQKQVDRDGVIRELAIDVDRIAKAEGAGLLSDALVDKAFADMCSQLGVAP